MKLKKLIAVVLALVLMFSLCSCGKMTAEKLIANMSKALTEVDSFAGTMNSGMEMGLSVFGESMTMSVTLDAKVSYYDKTTYTDGTTTTVIAGEEVSAKTEVYTVTSGDTITSYSLVDGTWYKIETAKPELNTSLDTVLMLINPENIGNIVLQDGLDTYNGREVYVLTIADCNYPELAADYINSQLGSVFGDMDISEIDLSGVVMQVTLKVYKDTKLPAVLTVDFGDSMTTIVESIMDVLLANITSGLNDFESAILGQLDISFEIPGAITTLTFDEYNIGPIVIPEEALDAEKPLNGGEEIFDTLF